MKKIKTWFKNFVRKYFDYDIVACYLDTKGDGRYQTKYMRKYYLRCFKKFRKKKKGGRK